jgi:lipopolysaccharide cholinephosphotransferase
LFSFDICFPAVTAAICSFANKYSAFNLILNGKLYIFADMMTTDTTQGKAGTADNQRLRARYNPDGSLLRHDQMELLDMLRVLASVCREHGIQWWLSSGTLLGAARHNGFIPWDDDMDIVMLRKDYRRLERVLKDTDSEFVLHSMRSDVEYVNCFGKFRKREGCVKVMSRRYAYYKWRGVGLDIFTIEKTNYFAARAASVIYNNLQHLTSYIRAGWLRRPLIRFFELLCLGVLNPLLRLVGLVNPRSEYHYSLGTGWAKHTFYMKDTFPLAEAEFEGVLFPVPKDMDAYLSNVYGDWRRLPSDEYIKKSIHCREYREEIFGKEND